MILRQCFKCLELRIESGATGGVIAAMFQVSGLVYWIWSNRGDYFGHVPNV